MFATVEFYEREKGVKNALRDFLFQPKITAEKVEMPENEYFYRLKVPVIKGRIPEGRLKKISVSMIDGMIFSENCGFIPEGVKIFNSKYFRELILFNTAVTAIKKSGADPTVTVITVIDKKGVLTSEIERLVSFACEIRVISDNLSPYRLTAQRLMEKYGLSLFVSNKLSSIASDGIIISPDSSVIPLSFRGIVITHGKRYFPFGTVLTGENIKVKEEYRRLCPENIQLEDFLAALCEVCYVKELRTTEYENLVDISSR